MQVNGLEPNSRNSLPDFQLTGFTQVSPGKLSTSHQRLIYLLCIGKFSDLPNIPDFSSRASFKGEVLHSMNYAAMDKMQAAKFIENKRVTVVGFQKSAVDTAAEIARNNGAKHPCTLVFRRVHWSGSETLVKFTFKNLTRFSQLMVHKPAQGLILCFLAFLLSPLVVEWYMGWIYPLNKYNMVPQHSFLPDFCNCVLFQVVFLHVRGKRISRILFEGYWFRISSKILKVIGSESFMYSMYLIPNSKYSIFRFLIDAMILFVIDDVCGVPKSELCVKSSNMSYPGYSYQFLVSVTSQF